MSLPVVGIDIAKQTFVVALIQEESIHRKEFANKPAGFTKLLVWVLARVNGPVHACMEATGIYGQALAKFLYQANHQVSVVNPARIAAYARSNLRRTKTDAADAQLIADFCRTQQPPLWKPPAPEREQLQSLVRRLEGLVELRQQESNRAESASASSLVNDSRRRLLRVLDREIAKLRKHLGDHFRTHDELRRQRELLVSIPGIGEVTATALLAHLPPLADFAKARQVAAYAGLNPHLRQSGSSLNHTALSKVGKPILRKILYMAAVTALKWNPPVAALSRRLRRKNKHSMAILGAAMRKLLHLAFGVVKSGRPFDPHYASQIAP